MRVDPRTGVWRAKVPAGCIIVGFAIEADESWSLEYELPEPEGEVDAPLG